MKTIKTCGECHTPFLGRNNQIYCSARCRFNNFHRNHTPIPTLTLSATQSKSLDLSASSKPAMQVTRISPPPEFSKAMEVGGQCLEQAQNPSQSSWQKEALEQATPRVQQAEQQVQDVKEAQGRVTQGSENDPEIPLVQITPIADAPSTKPDDVQPAEETGWDWGPALVVGGVGFLAYKLLTINPPREVPSETLPELKPGLDGVIERYFTKNPPREVPSETLPKLKSGLDGVVERYLTKK